MHEGRQVHRVLAPSVVDASALTIAGRELISPAVSARLDRWLATRFGLQAIDALY